MQPHENVSRHLPKSPEEEWIIASAVIKLLETVPEVWTEFSCDELTATEQRAFFLLVVAGMIERRTRFRIRLLNRPGGLEAVIGATGECGLNEAVEKILPCLWEEWQNAWMEWNAAGQIGSFPSHCERLAPDHWRLTDQGVLAAGDLQQKKTDDVLDFVLQRNFFHGRPAVSGSGELLSLQDLSREDVVSKTVHVGNWEEGAEAFFSYLAQSLVAAMDRVQKDDQSKETGQGGSTGESPPTESASEPQESDAPPELKPFTGGTMVFFRDRIDLCGVDICSGPRCQTKRQILDLLRKKRSDGNFIAYSSKEFAKVAGLKGGQNSAAGVIRDLRNDIVESLRSPANVECGRFDVIRSGGPGYRFAECLSVQDGDQRFKRGPVAPTLEHSLSAGGSECFLLSPSAVTASRGFVRFSVAPASILPTNDPE